MKPNNVAYPRGKAFISKLAWLFLIKFFKGTGLKLIFTSIASAAAFLAIIPTLWLVRYVFDRAIPENNVNHIIYAALGLVAIRLVTNVLMLIIKDVNLKLVTNSIFSMRLALLYKVSTLSRKYHLSQDYRVLQTRLVQDTERISTGVLNMVSNFLPAIIGVGVLTVLLFTMNWQLTLIMALGAPFIFLVNRLMKERLKNNVFSYQRAFEDFSKGNLFLLRFMDLIRVSAAEEKEIGNQKETLTNLKDHTHKRALVNTFYSQLLLFISGALGSIVLAVGGIAVAKGNLTLGSFLAFYMAANYLSQQLNLITSNFNTILAGNESLITLQSIYSDEDKIEYTGKQRPVLKGHFTLENVSFGYTKDALVLENLNLSMGKCEILALTGPNGAGKSTIINLLLGIYKPLKGRLLADGVVYENIEMDHLRKAIGMVFQHTLLIPGTIKENIAYGLSDVSQDQVEAVAKLTMAHDFIEKLDLGYDSLTGEDGVFLSGGERQKIAIARAILRRPKLLILDEPTNHLDVEAVETIMARIVENYQETSVLLISHNPQVLAHADRVLELRNKKLVEVKTQTA
jgi:ABC-type multidrug transport system fused ATPase/permease subunit